MLHTSLAAGTSSRWQFVAAVCGIGLLAAASLARSPDQAPLVLPITSTATETVDVEPAPPPVPPHADTTDLELALVFRAGPASYIKLGSDLPAHGTPRLYEQEGTYAAIAHVDVATLAPAQRAWHGERVVVDGTCEATIVGFAVIGRLTGSPWYAGLDGETEAWTAAAVLEHGNPVLAAKLSGCSGTFARAATLPPIVVPELVADTELEAKARATLLASDLAAKAQREWEELEQDGAWHEAADATFASQVVRHPTTGATWVWTHARLQEGCGGADTNLFGLFRVGDDGALVTAELRELGALSTIDRAIDVDNDGSLELVGKDWLDLNTLVTRANEDVIDSLNVAFYGCGC